MSEKTAAGERPAQTSGRVYLSIVAVFAIGQSIGAVDGVIAKIAVAFDISQATAMYCSTVGALVSVVVSMLVGAVAGRRVGYRPIAVVSGFLLVAGGVLPIVATSFPMLCALRAVFGVGLGGILAVQNPIAVFLVQDEQSRAHIVGIGTSVAFAFNCVEDVLGGVLGDIGWNLAFAVYGLLAIPYVYYAITLPKMPVVGGDGGGDENAGDVGGASGARGARPREPFPKVLVAMFAMIFVCGLCIAPLLVGCSFLSSAIIDSATVAGIAAVFFSVGCMLGGLLFPVVYGRVRRRGMTIFCVIAAVGLFGCAATRNIFLLCAFLAVAGIGFSSVQQSVLMLAGILCDQRTVSLASGMVMAALNLGTFLCTNWMGLVGMLTGDPLYSTVYIGAAAYLVFGAILLVRPPFPAR